MVIRASAAREIGRLLTDLEGGSAVQQEVAIARLAFIGPRAVEQLLSLLDRAPTGDVRASTLRALEAIGDGRALMPAVAALGDPHEAVGTAAVGVVRSHLLSEDGEAAATALDRLTALALDATGIDALRLAAIDALTDMPRDVVAPVLAHLQSDTNAPIRAGLKPRAATGRRRSRRLPAWSQRRGAHSRRTQPCSGRW